jgi:hypothetical protein
VIAVAASAPLPSHLRERPRWLIRCSSPSAPTTFRLVSPADFAVSLDGRMVLVARRGRPGKTDAVGALMASGTARLLPGTEAAGQPFWPPDGRSSASSERQAQENRRIRRAASHAVPPPVLLAVQPESR